MDDHAIGCCGPCQGNPNRSGRDVAILDIPVTGMYRDALDRRLITLLQANAREPTSSLARKLGVARSTVTSRLARLEKTGVIAGYTAILKHPLEAAGAQALVLLAVSQQQSARIVRELETYPEIKQCLAVNGEYDFYLRIEAEQLAALDELLDRIARIAGVQRSHSLIVLSEKFARE